ncbi:MAG: TatD family nuclease-associated radical SAM protein [Nanoarchaeota archaeon]|nr:TatD family nuclease-associated radical SAM protein [Nanoarchaeota archaeon]MBU1269615.1 TatD family nuclease-associated radical SAM protein [Nanoarchaeota archaeon]MBU1603821.1 TatD family nuclease-associated radical SAM protein [Nanoarchaeota archaeon]MBU2443253.1 TatD family nuclease-associated radical SAM protein [Nanoarchaeota archaeon]
MGKITYYCKDDKTKLYLNIIDNYACTNNCVFCDKLALEKSIGEDLFLEKKPGADEILESIKTKTKNAVPNEFIFCGIGEPTIYLDVLLQTIKALKTKYQAKIRLNTNGQASLINTGRDVVRELKKSGLDVVSISLNSTTKKEYNKLHRPKYLKNAFESVLIFIKDCIQVGLETQVTFVELKGLNKQRATNFLKEKKLEGAKIRFRKQLK